MPEIPEKLLQQKLPVPKRILELKTEDQKTKIVDESNELINTNTRPLPLDLVTHDLTGSAADDHSPCIIM